MFVGRSEELTRLAEGLEDAIEGRGRLFLISGEPGIGKSRLADEVGALATERGVRVLWGRSWEAGGAPAYWPWVQAIRSYLRNENRETLRRHLGSGAEYVAQMIPEVGELVHVRSAPPSEDPDVARFRLFDATTTFLKSATTAEPLVFVVDDLHAADTPSLLFLRFLAGELAESRLLVIGAYRDTEVGPGHRLRMTLAELMRLPGTHRLELRGLSETEVGRYVEAVTDRSLAAAVVTAIHRETDGNPLFVGEIARLLAAEGRLEGGEMAAGFLTVSEGVREVITRRLGSLSVACNDALTLASVLGREFDLEILKRASGLDMNGLLEVLQEAEKARLLTDVPGTIGRLRFSHALVRDALYEELPLSQRLRLHLKAAETLERAYGENPGPHLAELAQHFLAAAPLGEVAKAIDYTRRAAERATGLLAYEEGVRLYGMALRASELEGSPGDEDRCKLLLGLGDAEAKAGDMAAAKKTFREAAALARELGRRESLARAALGYGGRFVWARPGTDVSLIRLLEDALDALGPEDSELRIRVLARLAGALRDQRSLDSLERRSALSQEAVEGARRLGDPSLLAYALGARWGAIWGPDTLEERLAIATEAVGLLQESGDRERELQARGHLVHCLIEQGDIHAARSHLEIEATLAEQLRQPAWRWLVDVRRTTLRLLEGRFAEADRLVAEVLAIGRRALSMDAEVSYRLQIYALRREQGRIQEVEESIRDAAHRFSWYPMFQCVLAHVLAALGREAEAREILERLSANGFAALPADSQWLFGLSILSEACAGLEDRDRSAALYERLAPYADRNAYSPPEMCAGSVSRYLGLLATALSRWDRAAGHFEDALDANGRMGARPWVAHAQHDYARMLLLRGEPGDRERARGFLEAAAETAEALGMVDLSRRAVDAFEESSPGARISADATFIRRGEYWTVRFAGRAFRLKDAKGLAYVSELLRRPGREVHVLELVAGGDGVAPERTILAEAAEAGLRAAGAGVAEGPDPQARAAYRRRIAELESEVADLEERHDLAGAASLREEQELLAHELARSLGVGEGRRSEQAERARVAVAKAIRRALDKLDEYSPPLAHHLKQSLRTGVFCSYAPDPRDRVSWRL